MKIPSYDEFRGALEDAVRILKAEWENGYRGDLKFVKRRDGILLIENGFNGDILVVGDLHGDYRSLAKALELGKRADLVIFLGDYIDRGPLDEQIMVLYELLSRIARGENIILLRGNHEAPRGLEPSGQDFPYALYRFYGDNAGSLMELSKDLWDLMPYALVIENHALLLHGGPPTRNLNAGLLEYLGVGSVDRMSVLEEVLWNDPIEADIVRAPNPRGAGSLWGRPVTDIALGKVDGRVIIRGHEAVMTGHKWNHEGRVLTVFTSRIPVYPVESASVVLCRVAELEPHREDCVRGL
ncbi:MAG: serine/threonine protein phosphatase [Desulfurococcales archaeon]|nr:serine/threonine protein phosphatase [Desulfurococcales archaeon]